MVKKFLKHILYSLLSLIIVLICINKIFNGLHDYGRVGMLIGLVVSPMILIPFIYKLKWWTSILLIIFMILIPFPVTKFTMRYIYSFQEGGAKEVNFVLDVIGYILFFVISVILIEVGVAANKHYLKDSPI